MKLVASAPGKVNLCLFLGPVRPDGRHELVTVFESVSLADEVTVEPLSSAARAPAEADEIVCPGISGLNIVTQTLDGLRERGWNGPPVRVTIDKRIPIAGGMAGGSADAAALLRIAPALAPVPDDVIGALAASLGADVPSQLRPGLSLGTGAGDTVERLEPLAPHALVIVPQDFGLSTAQVYQEADRLGLAREPSELADRLHDVRTCADPPFVNDLEPAAVSLRPEIAQTLDAVRDTGAVPAMLSGSGPTVFGVFFGTDAHRQAEAAAGDLVDRYPGATWAAPVSEEFGDPRGS